MFDKTEDEQVAILKQWFQRYYIWLIALIVACGGGVAAWNYWQQTTDDEQLQASSLYAKLYQQVRAITASEEAQNQQQQIESIGSIATSLQTLFPENIYSMLGQQLYARALIEAQQYAQAAQEIEPLITNNDEFIRNNSRVLLARVYWILDRADEALQLLEDMSPGFKAVANELAGDIHLSQGRIKEATEFYEIALEQSQGTNNFLQLKLNNVKK